MPRVPTMNGGDSPRRPRPLTATLRGRRLLVAAAIVVILVLAAASTAAAAGSHPRTGAVAGIVVWGPVLPVDPGAGISWPPQKAMISVFKAGETTPLLTRHTGADGRFTVRLAAGRCHLSAQPDGVSIIPICHDVTVTIAAGDRRHVRLWLDTGVRFAPASGVKPADEPSGAPRHFHQGIVGTTRRGPITPVARPGEPNDAPCAATVRVFRPNGALAAVVHSSAKSGFAVDLPVGRYVVDPRSTGATSFDRATPFSMRVARGAWRFVPVMFDTGIR